MTKYMPGRTDNSIKNHFYSTVRRNLRRYNKKVSEEQKIHGSVQELIKDPDMLKILLVHSERKKSKEEKEVEKQVKEKLLHPKQEDTSFKKTKVSPNILISCPKGEIKRDNKSLLKIHRFCTR